MDSALWVFGHCRRGVSPPSSISWALLLLARVPLLEFGDFAPRIVRTMSAER